MSLFTINVRRRFPNSMYLINMRCRRNVKNTDMNSRCRSNFFIFLIFLLLFLFIIISIQTIDDLHATRNRIKPYKCKTLIIIIQYMKSCFDLHNSISYVVAFTDDVTKCFIIITIIVIIHYYYYYIVAFTDDITTCISQGLIKLIESYKNFCWGS